MRASRSERGFGTWSDAHRWATAVSIAKIRPENEGKNVTVDPSPKNRALHPVTAFDKKGSYL
jgi:hypothetical protein